MVGGGMRQAGIIAAAGIVALNEMVERLAEDHATAQRLAEGLAQLPRVMIDLETVQTNLVIFRVSTLHENGSSFAEVLGQAGVKIGDLGGGRLRAVTHYGISQCDIDEALRIIRETWQPAPA
jgi:threonine aldolase